MTATAYDVEQTMKKSLADAAIASRGPTPPFADAAPSGDPLLTMPEVASRTRVPLDTLRYWRHLGIGPESAKMGRRVVYRASDVEAWIAAKFEADRPTPAA